MDSSQSTSTQQSSGAEKTPDSGTSRTRRAKKAPNSPSLRAFDSFSETLETFFNHVLGRTDQIGIDPVDLLRTELEKMDDKCANMKEIFQHLMSRLDKAIEDYETKKPTDLPACANSVISPEAQAVTRSSSFKDMNTIHDIFAALNKCIAKIRTVVHKKIHKSVYDDQYSISLEKKLKSLKTMCEDESKDLEEIGKMIKGAIEKNEQLRTIQ